MPYGVRLLRMRIVSVIDHDLQNAPFEVRGTQLHPGSGFHMLLSVNGGKSAAESGGCTCYEAVGFGDDSEVIHSHVQRPTCHVAGGERESEVKEG